MLCKINTRGWLKLSIKKGILLATKMAAKSRHNKQHVGCAILRGGRVLSLGFNKKQYYKRSQYARRCAEIDAVIRSRTKDLSNAKMYVVRITPGGRIGLAKPCIWCQNYLKILGLRKIYFTTNNGSIGSMQL